MKKNKIKVEDAISYLALTIFTLFSINPIIQYIYHIFGGTEWYPKRGRIDLPILFIGAIVFQLYLIYKWFVDKPVGIFKVQIKNPALTLFVVFGILMTVSTFLNKSYDITHYGFYSVPLVGTSYRNEGLITYLSYLMFFLFAAFITNEKTKKTWLEIFTVYASFPTLIYVIDFIFPSLGLDSAHKYAFFNNPNHFAYYILVITLVSAGLFVKSNETKNKIVFGVLYSLGSFALIINNSLGCIVSLFVTTVFIVLVFSLCEGKIKFGFFIPVILFVIIIMLSVAFIPKIRDAAMPNIRDFLDFFIVIKDTGSNKSPEISENTSVAGRSKLWSTAISLIKQRPLWGYSADGIAYHLNYEAFNDRCHCEFMNYALSFGIPAMCIYIAAILIIFIRGLIHRKELTATNQICLCVAFGYLVSSSVGNSMFYTAPLLFIMLGFGYYRKSNK